MVTALSVNKGGLGRFGNQCFTIASTIGIAVKNGQSYGFPDWINKDNALFGGSADRMSKHFLNPLPQYIEWLYYQDIPYHWYYQHYTLPEGNWNICSHLQDPRYFEHCMPLIRHYFRVWNEPLQNEYVAIHYRAGDYIDDPNAYHPRCSLEYYLKAIALFPPDTRFLLFSDDLSAIDALRHNGDLFVRIEPVTGGGYIDDFALMKRCKSFITANSSFSLFAAILGEHSEKKIVCPERWFGAAADIRFEGYPAGATIL